MPRPTPPIWSPSGVADLRHLFGCSGAAPAMDPRELDRLANIGLAGWENLRAATDASASAAVMRPAYWKLVVGEPAALVLLPASPLVEPGVWRTVSAVFCR
jgi:hypothetical protein